MIWEPEMQIKNCNKNLFNMECGRRRKVYYKIWSSHSQLLLLRLQSVSLPPSLSHHLPSHGAFVLLFPYTLQLMSANKIHSLYPWRFTKSALRWDWGQHKIRFHFAILQFPLVKGSVESGLEHKMKQLLLAALCYFCDNFAKDDIRARTPTEKTTCKKDGLEFA